MKDAKKEEQARETLLATHKETLQKLDAEQKAAKANVASQQKSALEAMNKEVKKLEDIFNGSIQVFNGKLTEYKAHHSEEKDIPNALS